MNFLITIPNWNELAWYHYLAIGDVVVILALLLYFATRSRIKMPAIILGILGGVGVGAALGAGLVLAMIALNVQMDKEYATSGEETPASGGGPGAKGGGGGAKGGGAKGGGAKGGMPKGGSGGGGPRGPSPQAQLAYLVTKLDQLTHKPLSVTFDAEQKKKVRESLEKLDTEKSLSDDQARAKLEDLRKILNQDQRKTLEEAGYLWPGQAATPYPAASQEAPPNPLSEGENNKHLKSLLGSK